jgi:hypothetical protein
MLELKVEWPMKLYMLKEKTSKPFFPSKVELSLNPLTKKRICFLFILKEQKLTYAFEKIALYLIKR